MGTLGDLLVLGEGPSIVADADVDLLGRACELLWSRAVDPPTSCLIMRKEAGNVPSSTGRLPVKILVVFVPTVSGLLNKGPIIR